MRDSDRATCPPQLRIVGRAKLLPAKAARRIPASRGKKGRARYALPALHSFRARRAHTEIDQATQRLRARRPVGLLRGPGVYIADCLDREAQGYMRVLTGRRPPASPLFLCHVFS